MRRPLLLRAAILVALTGAAGAQSVPIGPAAWQKPNGQIQRAMGMGGTPVLNYQKADLSWDEIVDDWVQVGDRQVWKSIRGNHRVFADSTGAAIYAKGNHYLGTQTTHLVKFDESDSTWVTLRASLPDSVRTSGREIVFHGIFPGVDKKLVNNAKILKRYAETFIFHQQARDSLAAWGPWSGYLLGTATKLNVDSLNLTLRDAAGVFGINATGRMVDEWVSLGSADTSAFYLGTASLQAGDSTTTIPVKKWIVQFAGSPWLVEMFDPIEAGGLPAGDVSHDAIFGDENQYSIHLSISGTLRGGLATMGATDGTVDEITAFLSDAGGDANDSIKYAVYLTDHSFHGTTVTQVQGGDSSDAWLALAASGTINLTASTEYVLVGWSNLGSSAMHGELFLGCGNVFDTCSGFVILDFTETWPASPTFIKAVAHPVSIYCTYTEAAASQIIIIGGD